MADRQMVALYHLNTERAFFAVDTANPAAGSVELTLDAWVTLGRPGYLALLPETGRG